MREFRGYKVAPFYFEFNILRIQGGIRDLETALVDDWSPVRSDAAIRRFRQLVRRSAVRSLWTRPSTWFEAMGWNYDDYFKGRFTEASKKYCDSLVDMKWRSEWPFPTSDIGTCELFIRKLLHLLRVPTAFDFEYSLAAPDDFLQLTRDYLDSLMQAFTEPGAHTVVMHNTFEPFNPTRAIRYFYDARSIIVDRDPRDVYVAQNSYVAPGTKAKPGRYRAVAVPPDIFIRRFRLWRLKASEKREDSQRVLRLRFEDLVLRYADTLAKIRTFLDENMDSHLTPMKYFNPVRSSSNIGLWHNFPDQSAISLIGKELSEFCVNP